MNVRNCRLCGRIFNYISGIPTCQSCKEKMEQKFQEVKEYVRNHTGATIPEVAEECDVDQAQIRAWLKDDRLELTENSPIRLACENCGAQIRSGRFCDKCKSETMSGFNDILKANQPPKPERTKHDRERDKMRFL